MNPRHHLDPATIVSHAAGALSPEMAAVVATHLEGCGHCRQAVAQADGIGGALMAQRQGAELPEDQKPRFQAISEELASLSAKFSENLLDATNAFAEFVTEESKLAGIPDRVITRAREILKELESGAPETAKPAAGPVSDQVSMLDMQSDELRRALEAVTVETLTPIEAMNVLYQLKQLL